MAEERTQATRVVGAGARAVRVLVGCDLEVLDGPGRGTRARLDKPRFTIGSHASNDLQLPDETVSRHHLEIRAEPEGYRVVDLGSSNGTVYHRDRRDVRLGELVVTEPIVLVLGATTLGLTPGGAETEVPGSTATSFGTVIGQSVAMRELFAQLEAVAGSDCSLLLEGETGAGKERVAESVHRESARGGGPFVVVDCGAMAGGLMESELFGHVRGAFTGAEQTRTGLVEMAHGGTLFLDEVGELPLTLQAKLLGVLTRGKLTPVGGTQPRKVDVRVIAATHRNLPRAVNEGLFRAELFYRLAVVRLRVPPLRERLDDIPLLVEEILRELRARGEPPAGKDRPGADQRAANEHVPGELSAVALAHLLAQPWPGNVRELRNTVETAALAASADAGKPAARRAVETEPYTKARDRFIADYEQRYLLEALERCGQNVSEAARQAGLDRRNFQRLLRRHHIDLRKP